MKLTRDFPCLLKWSQTGCGEMFYVAKRDKRTMLIVALLIVFAVLLRQAYQVFGNGTPATVSCAILRSLIYIGLFAA